LALALELSLVQQLQPLQPSSYAMRESILLSEGPQLLRHLLLESSPLQMC